MFGWNISLQALGKLFFVYPLFHPLGRYQQYTFQGIEKSTETLSEFVTLNETYKHTSWIFFRSGYFCNW